MENATKALIIAGSILIVILLIAMGVKIFSSTSGTTDNVETTMNATEIATFNSKFLGYNGSNQSLAKVKSLANIIISNNATNSSKKVKFNSKETSNEIMTALSNLTGDSFKITINIDNNTGLVTSVSVSKSN